jgi:hypothetical protein
MTFELNFLFFNSKINEIIFDDDFIKDLEYYKYLINSTSYNNIEIDLIYPFCSEDKFNTLKQIELEKLNNYNINTNELLWKYNIYLNGDFLMKNIFF